ncbi:hypothetical protein [Erysipelothrix anatis]|uniref:hypothetical protein n=1 Tax=Erysipelothrix anatis TaxID=2683713 RepID=UPI00135AB0FE|nr:hypothetical protein [Erysipelothrix anatis]
MKLKIPNNKNIECFEVAFTPITPDIYFQQFRRDLSLDIITSRASQGDLGMTLTQRIIWSCCMTQNHEFMQFQEFLEIIDGSISAYLTEWGPDVDKWLMPIIDNLFS